MKIDPRAYLKYRKEDVVSGMKNVAEIVATVKIMTIQYHCAFLENTYFDADRIGSGCLFSFSFPWLCKSKTCSMISFWGIEYFSCTSSTSCLTVLGFSFFTVCSIN